MARPRRAPARRPRTPGINALINQYIRASLQTPAQQRKQARRETNLAIKDSMRQLRTTVQREREGLLREQYGQGAWAGLLRGYGAEGSAESQAIKDAYARAAGITSQAAQGFITPTIAQQQQYATAGQEASQAVAGYTGDVGTAAPGANAAVLGYLASLPRGTFEAEARAEAAGLGSAAAQAGAPFAFRQAELGQALRDLRDEYTMAVRDIQAKRPGMLQEALTGLRGERRSDFASIINALYLQNTLGRTQAELTGVYRGRPTQAARAQAAAQAMDAAKLAEDIRQYNESLAVRQMNAKTSRMQANIAKQRLRQQRTGQAGDTVKLEQQFRQDAQKYIQNVLGIDKKLGRPRYQPPSKATLVQAIMNVYGRPLAGRYGLTPAQLRAWSQQVVNTFPNKYWTRQYGVGRGGSTKRQGLGAFK
jgi:hypothetical protein